jgi:putative endonuclease
MSPDPRHALGRRGEGLAAEALRRQGYRILATNVRTPYGELDLVARQGKWLVFVEVKARSSAAFGAPEEAVGPVKRRRLSKSALHWLTENGLSDAPARFDVVGIMDSGAGARVNVIKNAFDLEVG